MSRTMFARLGWLAAGLLLLAREGLAAELAAWLWELLAPFVIGGLLAFLLAIPMEAVEKNLPAFIKKGRRPFALVITLLGALAILLLAGFLVLPQLAESIRSLALALPALWRQGAGWLAAQLERSPWLAGAVESLPLTETGALIQAALEAAGGGTVSSLGSLMGSLADFLLGLVFACYILLHRATLHRQGSQLAAAWLPAQRAKKLLVLLRLVGESFRSFIAVQCLEAAILGAMLWGALTLCRMPSAILISVVVALTAVIPIFGSFAGGTVGFLLVLAQEPARALWFLVVFLCVQQIEGSLVYPRVVGNRVGLPPIWVLAAVTLGGRLFGVLGMVLMIPVFSVLYSLLGRNTRRRLGREP